MKFKIGDQILVTAGKDKGQKGKIERIFTTKQTVFVPNVNVYKRHKKASSGQEGGIIEFSRPIPIGNIALICPACGKRTRIAYKKNGNTKVRICIKCKKEIDIRKETKK